MKEPRHLKAPRIQSEMQPARGDVVPQKENSPRGTWKLGMIEQLDLITSSDGEVRAATVRTGSGKMLNRTLNFLYPLECSVSDDKPTKLEETVVDNETQDDASKQKTDLVAKRPIRRAAIKARRFLNKLLNT